MPKVYYPSEDELQGSRPLNELLWFPRFQRQLVRLANTSEGRDLLCLDKHPYQILALEKNRACYDLSPDLGPGAKLSDFRVGAKWGNIIRYRWQEVRNALARMEFQEMQAWPNLAGNRLAAARFTHVTYYPEAHEESSTVDGNYDANQSETAWNTIREHGGVNANDTATADATMLLSSGPTDQKWDLYRCGCALFSTSSIGGDTKNSGILSWAGEGATADNFSLSVGITAATLASATAVVAGDFDGRGFTRFCDTDVAFSAWAVSGSYNNFTLNTAGLAAVSTSGVSSFGVTTSADIDNTGTTGPTWASNTTAYATTYFADQSGTSTDPKLVVVHTSLFTPRVIMF